MEEKSEPKQEEKPSKKSEEKEGFSLLSMLRKDPFGTAESAGGLGLLGLFATAAVAGLATLVCWGGCQAYHSIRDFYYPAEQPKIEELAPHNYVPEYPKQDPLDSNPIAYSPKRQQPFSNTNNYSQV